MAHALTENRYDLPRHALVAAHTEYGADTPAIRASFHQGDLHGGRHDGQSTLGRLREVVGYAVEVLLVLDPRYRQMGNYVGPFTAIRRSFISIPNRHGELTERFIRIRHKVKNAVWETPDRRKRKSKRR